MTPSVPWSEEKEPVEMDLWNAWAKQEVEDLAWDFSHSRNGGVCTWCGSYRSPWQVWVSKFCGLGVAASDSSIGGDEGFQRAAVEAAEAFQPTELDRVFGDESRWKLESAAAAAVVVAAAAVAATAAVAVEMEEEGVFFWMRWRFSACRVCWQICTLIFNLSIWGIYINLWKKVVQRHIFIFFSSKFTKHFCLAYKFQLKKEVNQQNKATKYPIRWERERIMKRNEKQYKKKRNTEKNKWRKWKSS